MPRNSSRNEGNRRMKETNQNEISTRQNDGKTIEITPIWMVNEKRRTKKETGKNGIKNERRIAEKGGRAK